MGADWTGLDASLKSHFLIGALKLFGLVFVPITHMFSRVGVGIKLFSRNDASFCAHMRGYIPHITDQNHQQCQHAARPPKATPRLNPANTEAIATLREFIEGYLADRQRYLHGYNTIHIESLNSSICKRADKERNWTVMYAPLIDAGILERNEGISFFILFLTVIFFIIVIHHCCFPVVVITFVCIFVNAETYVCVVSVYRCQIALGCLSTPWLHHHSRAPSSLGACCQCTA